jgi:hypothetical protein
VTKLELYVKFEDGRGAVTNTFRDDPKGREQCDKVAFAKMRSGKVRYVSVERTERAGGYDRSGR